MGRIVNGKYESGIFQMADAVPTKTSVWKNSDHDRQRADHQWELISPFDKNGKLSDEFINAYPEEAKASYGFDPDANLELKKKDI